jgi:predicted transcriptional regulator with HTH domain
MRLSQEKRDKIAEQVLSHLFHSYPKTFFTSEIAQELARDEEFIKSLLMDLKAKDLVASVKKNSSGIFYSRRIRWRLSNKAHDVYKTKV